METTWRARPMPVGRLGLVLLLTLLIAALMGAALIVGSRLLLVPDRGLNAAPVIPKGGVAVLAYANFSRGDANGDIYTMRADGTDRRHIGRGFDPTWSPDGSMIAFYTNPGSSGWDLMVADSTGVRPLAREIGCAHLQVAPTWSPDSRFVLYPVYRGASAGCYGDPRSAVLRDLYVVPADGSGAGRLLVAPPATACCSADWSPDGTKVALEVSNPTLDVQGLWIAEVTDPDAPWDLVAHQVSPAGGPLGWPSPRWSPDGSLIATSVHPVGSDVADSIVITADGADQRPLWTGPEDDANPEWSPDGSRLITLVQAGQTAEPSAPYDAWLVDPDGTDPRRVDAPPLNGWAGGLPFSPDGTRVIGMAPAPLAGGRSPWDLYVVTLDGGSEPVVADTTSRSDGSTSTASWQPVISPESPLTWALPVDTDTGSPGTSPQP